MPDVAIIVLAGTEAPSDLGRVVNALQTAREFDQAGDDVQIIFDGAGTQWIPELEDEGHDYHAIYDAVTEHVHACDYCAGAYGVDEAIDESRADRRAEFEGHPSVQSLVADGYEVITY